MTQFSYEPDRSDEAHVYFFSGEIPQGDPEGDQAELFRLIQILSHAPDQAYLYIFLKQAAHVVREEIAQLPSHLRDLAPWVGNILDWTHHVVALRKTALGGSIERVLVCVYQICLLMIHRSSLTATNRVESWQTCLLGKGTGLLTAASLALSSNLNELAKFGAIVVGIAFRTGLMVERMSGSVEVLDRSTQSPEPWLVCVHGLTEEEVQAEVEKYNTLRDLPKYRAIFVCNTTGSSVSISGPPSVLTGISARLKTLPGAKCVPMTKIQGISHAGHLYTSRDVQWIVPAVVSQSTVQTQLVLPTTGPVPAGTSATEVLRMIVHQDLSTKQLQSAADTDAVESLLNHLGTRRCTIYTVRHSSHADELNSRLLSRVHGLDLSCVQLAQSFVSASNIRNATCKPHQSKIAVVGMSCRFPDGTDDVGKFWDLLAGGHDAHREIPADRFDVRTHVDPTGQTPNASKTPYGCFIQDPSLFDAAFFSMSRREAEQTDPMHRLALVTAHEALEHSGYTPNSSKVAAHRIGTFYGQASDDYREANSNQHVGTYYIPGGCRAFAPGRINYVNKFSGPSFSCDTACSSSLATLQLACTSLWANDADMMVVGGLNVLTNCDVYAGLSHGHFLSKTGGCKTWDEEADGYCRADGVGSVVLKRLEDAEADNDNILGVILSAATNHSAEAVSITHPHTGSQAALYRQVIRRAGVDPRDVGYVEFHGTGTQSGDATELAAVTDVFAPLNRPRTSAQPLYIGSVKANFGHGEAAAGIMAFIKSLLILQKGVIPPHIGVRTKVSHHFPIDAKERNMQIPTVSTPWTRQTNGKRTMIINNFGAAGGNTAVAMEEADGRERDSNDGRKLHAITVSAKSRQSLTGNISRILDWLEDTPSVHLSDVAYTTNARRAHYPLRSTFLVDGLDRLKADLRSRLGLLDEVVAVPKIQPSVAFAFTGQGVFYAGIGVDLYHGSANFRRDVDFLNDLGTSMGLPSIVSTIDGSLQDIQDLPSPIVHLAIVVIEIAMTWYWRNLGIKPQFVIGHSLGELAALNAAGVLSTADTLFIAGKRAELLDRALKRNTHHMVAAFATIDEIKDALNGSAYTIALRNSPSCHVLAGTTVEITAITAHLKCRGIKLHPLSIPYAFHSSQMDSVIEELAEIVDGVQFHSAKLPIISPQLPKVVPVGSTEIQSRYVTNAIRDSVHYYDALNLAKGAELFTSNTLWVEIGTHPVCTEFIKSTLGTKKAFPSLRRNESNWTTIITTLAALHQEGVAIDWREYHRPFESALRLVDMPHYAWNNQSYWISYEGDWLLTKNRGPSSKKLASKTSSSLHNITSTGVEGGVFRLEAKTNVLHAELLPMVKGHAMNDVGVMSSYVHTDMALAAADQLVKAFDVNSRPPTICVRNLLYHDPVCVQEDRNKPQFIKTIARGTAATKDISIGFYRPESTKPYAECAVSLDDGTTIMHERQSDADMVSSRIATLRNSVSAGAADKVSKRLIYRMFANLVDYSEQYQNMTSVILQGLEAFAEVTLPEAHGHWHLAPHWADALISLPGFVLNGGDVFDTKKYFFVTPGWDRMILAREFKEGEKLSSYVKIEEAQEQGCYVGDVFIFDAAGSHVGLVERVLYRRWPRVMLNRFFSPPDASASTQGLHFNGHELDAIKPTPRTTQVRGAPEGIPTMQQNGDGKSHNGEVLSATSATSQSATWSGALSMIAEEVGCDITTINDNSVIADIGMDSLMSLVISQRFRADLGVEIRDGFFSEVDTLGDLRQLIGCA